MNTDVSWRNRWRFRRVFEKVVGSVFNRFRNKRISVRGVVTTMMSQCPLFLVSRDQIIHGFRRKSKYVTQFLKTYPEVFFLSYLSQSTFRPCPATAESNLHLQNLFPSLPYPTTYVEYSHVISYIEVFLLSCECVTCFLTWATYSRSLVPFDIITRTM
jgi:hypothetical protein